MLDTIHIAMTTGFPVELVLNQIEQTQVPNDISKFGCDVIKVDVVQMNIFLR